MNLELFFGTEQLSHEVQVACYCYLRKVGCPPTQIGARQEEIATKKVEDVEKICQRNRLTLVLLPTDDIKLPPPGHFYLYH